MGLGLLSRAETTGLERACWAEAQGYDSVWVPDGDGKMHALTLAGAVAARTERVTIGTGIVPVYTHTPAVLAAASLAMAELAPQRFILGLGSSSHAMMENWNGIPFVKPLTRVRETTEVLRGMLAGERVAFEGETLRTQGFRLNPAPASPVPIYLAALRPRMLELAGDVADGVILHLTPLRGLPRALEHVAAGAAQAGRSLAELDIACRFNVVVGDDRQAALEEARSFIVRYYSTPVYNKHLAWCGYADEAQRIADGFAQGDRAATRAALTDELVSSLCIVGTEDECHRTLREFIAAGITTPIINPLATELPQAERAMEAFLPRNFT